MRLAKERTVVISITEQRLVQGITRVDAQQTLAIKLQSKAELLGLGAHGFDTDYATAKYCLAPGARYRFSVAHAARLKMRT